jgi:hypothetical protein
MAMNRLADLAVEQPDGADGAGKLERRRSSECSTDVDALS